MKRGFLALGILTLATHTVLADYADKITKLARDCRAGKSNSCQKLAMMATEDPDGEVRKAAVEQLSDQPVLSKIAKTDSRTDVSLAAVERLTDQALLAEVVKTSAAATVREAAVKKLADQATLAEIARMDGDATVRLTALSVLRDEVLLAEVAKAASDPEVSQAAVTHVSDQKALADIAKHAEQAATRVVAAEQLRDQALLTDLAKAASDPRVRRASVQRLGDQAALTEVARGAGDWEVRRAAVVKLTGQTTLAEIARNDSEPEVRQSAVLTLADQVLLAEIARTSSDAATRSAAVTRLTDQAHLAEIAAKDNAWNVRSAAVSKLTDQAAVARSARRDSDPNVRSAAVWRLSDQTLLGEIARKDSDSYVREAAAEKLKLGARPDTRKIVTEIELIEKLELQGDSGQFTLAARDLRQLLAFVLTPYADGYFDRNRLVLIDEDGTVFRYVAVAPIVRQNSAWIANGAPLPLNEHDVTIDFATDRLAPAFKPRAGDARVSWSGTEARLRVLFEVAKNSRNVSLRFGPLPAVPLLSADEAARDYVIKDPKFIDESLPSTSQTDVLITGADASGFECSGQLDMRNGEYLLFADGAKHTWVGTVGAFGYVFSSDAARPLMFRVDRAKGYTHLKGTGTIKFPDGRTVVLAEK
jgi:hypothetical protein